MPNILNEPVEAYLGELLPPRDSVITDMEEFARRNQVPIVGPVVGRLLSLVTQIGGAQRIFEMGSAIGYSTIWLARAAGPRAEVYYTDGSEANAERAKGFLRRAGVARRIKVQTGDAIAFMKKASGKFDFIFNDIDKHQYPDALR